MIPAERATGLVVARDWTLLLALVLPFVGQAFPYGFPLFLPFVLMTLILSVLLAAWREGIWRVSAGRGWFAPLVVLGLIFFLYGLLITRQWDDSLRSELVNAVAILLLWLAVANVQWSRPRLIWLERRVIDLLSLTTAMIGTLALYKFMLLLKGQKLGFIADSSSGAYPWGTSLTSDYNMFALTMLAGMLAATAWLVGRRPLLLRLIACAVIGLLAVAGFLSGSRRFWVVAPLAILLLFAGYARQRRMRDLVSGSLLLAGCVLALALVVYHFVQLDWQKIASAGFDLQARLASVLDENSGGGLDSRVRRWNFAFGMLTDWRIWSGSGFGYLQVFGCEFGDCRSASYPHNPLISALLYAGVPGMIAMLALLLYMAWCGLRLLSMPDGYPFLGTLLLAHLPITFISSNGLFAVKSLLVMALLGALFVRAAGAERGLSTPTKNGSHQPLPLITGASRGGG